MGGVGHRRFGEFEHLRDRLQHHLRIEPPMADHGSNRPDSPRVHSREVDPRADWQARAQKGSD